MNTFGRRSVILASLALPLTVLVGSIVAWAYKTSNPDNVDITAGLAYLRPILVSSVVTFVVVMGAALTFAFIGKKRDNSAELSYLGLSLVVVITLLSVAAGIAQNGTGRAEDDYRQRQAERFFEAIESQRR